jgi:ribosomal protein S21
MLFVVRVVLHDGESLENALWRFNNAVRREYDRPWYKHRYGYYEKPSRLRQKRRKMRSINRYGNLKLHISLVPLFEPIGSNAAGH